MSRYLRIGDKISIPLSKSIGVKFHKSLVIKRCLEKQQGYVYIVGIYPNQQTVDLAESEYGYGETFLLSDLSCKSFNKLTDLKLLKEIQQIAQELNEKEKVATRKTKTRRVL
jgi:hypothetical protein